MSGWFLGGTIIVALALLWIAPLTVGFSLSFQSSRLDFRIVIGLVHPLRLSLPLPLKPLGRFANPDRGTSPNDQHAQPRPKNKMKQRIGSPARLFFFRLAALFFTSVRSIEAFQWHMKVGTGDAAVTSYLVGGGWAVQSMVVSWLRRHYAFLSEPSFSAAADYNQPGLALEACCIFRFTIGEIIVAMVTKSFPFGFRGVRSFGPKPTSH